MPIGTSQGHFFANEMEQSLWDSQEQSNMPVIKPDDVMRNSPQIDKPPQEKIDPDTGVRPEDMSDAPITPIGAKTVPLDNYLGQGMWQTYRETESGPGQDLEDRKKGSYDPQGNEGAMIMPPEMIGEQPSSDRNIIDPHTYQGSKFERPFDQVKT